VNPSPASDDTLPTPDRLIAEWQAASPLPGLVWPDYAGGCITHVSEIIRQALGKTSQVPSRLLPFAAPADRIVLIIVDGLGYHALKRFRAESSVIERVMDAATGTVLTSTFPSTTPAALTSLYTGASPREHGLMGGNVFLREKGLVANLIRFSPMEDPRRDVFLDQGLELKAFCPVRSVFEKLGRRNSGAAWVPGHILNNALCRICTSGAPSVHPFPTPSQAMVGARKNLEGGGPRFQCMYWDATDGISHARGPYSEEYRAEVAAFFHLLEDELLTTRPKEGKTRILLTADHGHALVKKSRILRLCDYPDIQKRLMFPRLGGTRVPYLQSLPGEEEALREASKPLEEHYHILNSKEMLEKGLFGPDEGNPEAEHRIGTWILVPREDQTFFPKDPAHFTTPLRGDHDALSAEEMTVPLLMWELEG
jgi:hypothetical protein